MVMLVADFALPLLVAPVVAVATRCIGSGLMTAMMMAPAFRPLMTTRGRRGGVTMVTMRALRTVIVVAGGGRSGGRAMMVMVMVMGSLGERRRDRQGDHGAGGGERAPVGV